MMKTLSLAAAAFALTAGGIAATPASAQYYGGSRYDNAYNDAYRDGYNRGPSYHYEDRGGYYDGRGYNDGRGYDRRRYRSNQCSSATGTILGAIAGGLLGNGIAGRGDRGLGTVLGAGAGALAGRAIDQSDNPRYCR